MSKLTEPFNVYLVPKYDVGFVGGEIKNQIQRDFKVDTGCVMLIKIFEVSGLEIQKIGEKDLVDFARKVLCDPIQFDCVFSLKELNKQDYSSFIVIGKYSGVTDDEGSTANETLHEFLDIDKNNVKIKTKELYLFEKFINEEVLHRISVELLSNPLIHYSCYSGELAEAVLKREEFDTNTPTVKFIDLNKDVSDERHLGLNDLEIKAIRKQYEDKKFQELRALKGLPDKPSDCELELLAQTWSEHCKHKEFNAIINYYDKDLDEHKVIHSLFNTYIRSSTLKIKKKLEERGHNWLVKVFNDNAGIVRVDKENYFVWKVETHNSPTVLDPYGGAITGILGSNRDALGTGIGGAKLLFNTNVLCFGPPDYDKPLLAGQKHPKQILSGVVRGIMDGGNKSGIPTVNGSVHFDDRYAGKPLVFCGTGGIMKSELCGKSAEDKPIKAGDYIVMAGGRVGKDGIHGATLSSSHIDKNTPGSMVQIGSPMTQKKLSDFLEKACLMGLVKTCTDNGAGGLGSSVGEMAAISGGAFVEITKVPLKYNGLAPWEIFISESQERMTLVVDPECFGKLLDLAKSYQVEISHIGNFSNSGLLEVFYNGETIALLSLDFLHNGVPIKEMEAVWEKTHIVCSTIPTISSKEQYNKIILDLLNAYNICSRESIIRQYDHEVKANTVVKPLMGSSCNAPQDAAVVRLSYDSYEALVISNGILPRLGDIDAYQMSAGSLDEAVRQIIAVGGELPDLSQKDSNFWSINDNFCLPNCAFDDKANIDGRYKLAQLVKMCEALYDYSTFFLVPMTSGKDSMKNDFIDGKQKISIPPTVLYSCVSKINDFRKVTTAHFKQPSDLIYLLGDTYDEMAASELYHLLKVSSDRVPIVRKEEARACYKFVTKARNLSLLSSCHDISDGGLAIALIESAFGGNFGIEINIPESRKLSPLVWLFSESPSRFIVSVKEKNREAFERLEGIKPIYLGRVTNDSNVRISSGDELLVDLTINECVEAWKNCNL
jgi:phosphoribosylformylglycinamidine synthase subunit PurSL